MTAERIHEPVAVPQRAGHRPPDSAATRGVAVTVAGVNKQFDGKTVLSGIELSIAAGEFVAVVGRSGCGKSTLLRLLAGLDSPTAGLVALDGQPVRGPLDSTRLMFQDARLLPWRRVLHNVGLGLRGDWRPVATAALDQVGLADRAGDWPAVLSGGQRQRVALARALVGHPTLMLLDEPLGALDALTRIDMQGLIERLWRDQGFTAVLVTHDVSEAVALADRVIMIDHGRIVLDRQITLPRPRRRSTAAFAELEGEILSRVLERPA